MIAYQLSVEQRDIYISVYVLYTIYPYMIHIVSATYPIYEYTYSPWPGK